MAKEKTVVLEEEWGKVVVMDSGAQMDQDEVGQVIVAGSHGAEFAARHVARFLPFGVVLNDAGKGKNNAGISGLPVLDAMNILGATIDCMSARIGEGEDSYLSGIISAVNDKAGAAGIEVGMTVIEAARIMLAAKKSGRVAYNTSVVYEDAHGRIILADTISYLNADHRGCVIVCGSHCAHTTFDWVKEIGLKGIFQNDAGKGKENQGISGLPLYDRAGIPAGAIDCMTAMIGDAQDAWETGLVSAANELATGLGVEEGMPVQEAATRVLRGKR
jgi:uncharacterized protein YunC (DUF1805 family)